MEINSRLLIDSINVDDTKATGDPAWQERRKRHMTVEQTTGRDVLPGSPLKRGCIIMLPQMQDGLD
jgi:hypothetical protein